MCLDSCLTGCHLRFCIDHVVDKLMNDQYEGRSLEMDVINRLKKQSNYQQKSCLNQANQSIHGDKYRFWKWIQVS